jgi:DNA-binding SARP family transcriptional activator
VIEFRLLGPVELHLDGRQVPLGPSRQRAVLAVLLASVGSSVPVETLIERVWDDAPPNGARGVVHTYVSRLRGALRAACAHSATCVTLVRTDAGYAIQAEPDQVDLKVFQDLIRRARTVAPGEARRRAYLDSAWSMWRGEPLAGIGGAWAGRVRMSQRHLLHELVIMRAWEDVSAGRTAAAVADLRQALLEAPLAEELHEALIRILCESGHQNEGLRQYERARRAFAEELGTDLSSSLQRLHLDILRELDENRAMLSARC